MKALKVRPTSPITAERRHVLVTAAGLPWERVTNKGKAQGQLLQRFKDCWVKAVIVDQKAVEARKSLRETVLAKKRRGEALTDSERRILRDPTPLRGCVREGATLHALRRTFVTNLVRAGANIKTVAELAGRAGWRIGHPGQELLTAMADLFSGGGLEANERRDGRPSTLLRATVAPHYGPSQGSLHTNPASAPETGSSPQS